MSIPDLLEKIKPLYTPILIVIVACLFFVLGRLSVDKPQENEVKIGYIATNSQVATSLGSDLYLKTGSTTKESSVPTDGPVIGKKSGKKYYFPWCGTVKRIKPENQIHFNSIQEARKSGFLPGGNCKGLN